MRTSINLLRFRINKLLFGLEWVYKTLSFELIILITILFLNGSYSYGQVTFRASTNPGATNTSQGFSQKEIKIIEGDNDGRVLTYEFNIAGPGISEAKYYMQIYDLNEISLDHVYSGVNAMKEPNIGVYHPNSPSPRFDGLNDVTAYNQYTSLWGNKVRGMVNTAFAEDPDIIPIGAYDHTSSFPVKLNGKLISGGSGPLGPGGVSCLQNPNSNFCGQLKALVWDNNTGVAAVVNYNPSNGSPLNTYPNGIVSYSPALHPASAGSNPPPEKIHIVATDSPGKRLFILTSINAQESIPKVGEKMSAILINHFGFSTAQATNLTVFDGGSSTFVRTKEQGAIIRPIPQPNLNPGIVSRDLGFYLGFREKGITQQAPQIIIRSPKSNINIPEANNFPALLDDKPFFIMWEANLNTNVKIELYNGNDFVSTIYHSFPNTGVYEWIPKFNINTTQLDYYASINRFNTYKIVISSVSGGTSASSQFFTIYKSCNILTNGDLEGVPGDNTTPSSWFTLPNGSPDVISATDALGVANDPKTGTTFVGLIGSFSVLSGTSELIRQNVYLPSNKTYTGKISLARAIWTGQIPTVPGYQTSDNSILLIRGFKADGTTSISDQFWQSPIINSTNWTEFSFSFTTSREYSGVQLIVFSEGLDVGMTRTYHVLVDDFELCESNGGTNLKVSLDNFLSESEVIRDEKENFSTLNFSPIKASPNPFSDQVTFYSTKRAKSLSIFNLQGQIIWQKKYEDFSSSLLKKKNKSNEIINGDLEIIIDNTRTYVKSKNGLVVGEFEKNSLEGDEAKVKDYFLSLSNQKVQKPVVSNTLIFQNSPLISEENTNQLESHSNSIYNYTWDTENHSGNKVLPGLYIYKIDLGNEINSGKIIYQPH